MLACLDRVDIDQLMQVVTGCGVVRLDLRVIQQLLVVGCVITKGGNLPAEPLCSLFIHITCRDDNGLKVQPLQMAPPCRCTGKLSAHQSASNDTELDLSSAHELLPSGFVRCFMA